MTQRRQVTTTLKHVVRLVFMNVQGGSADASVLQSLCQSRFIDQASTCRVNQEGAGSHLFDRVLVDQVMVVFI